MASFSTVARVRGHLGQLVLTKAPAEEIEQARRELDFAVREHKIAFLIEADPPLPPEHRERLIVLLQVAPGVVPVPSSLTDELFGQAAGDAA